METTTIAVAQPAEKAEAKTKKRIAIMPLDEQVLAELSKNVSAQWIASGLMLQWMGAAEFKSIADNYAIQLGSKNTEHGTRPQLSKRLKELDTMINEHIVYIKNYIAEEVGKDNGPAYYGQFGIERESKTYKLPKDRNKRAIALQTLLNGLTTRKYGNKAYGTAFWKPIATEYAEKTEAISQKDTHITSIVSEKNKSKEQIKKVLNAVIHLLKANYPDTYAAELRKWGFQREKY